MACFGRCDNIIKQHTFGVFYYMNIFGTQSQNWKSENIVFLDGTRTDDQIAKRMWRDEESHLPEDMCASSIIPVEIYSSLGYKFCICRTDSTPLFFIRQFQKSIFWISKLIDQKVSGNNISMVIACIYCALCALWQMVFLNGVLREDEYRDDKWRFLGCGF